MFRCTGASSRSVTGVSGSTENGWPRRLHAGPALSGRARVLLWDRTPRWSDWVVGDVAREQFPFASVGEQRDRVALLERSGYRTVFARDEYMCQYCGHTAKDLTIDHVVPKRHGGPTAWDNLVCSCRRCNMKKGDKMLHQTSMKLMRQPHRPKYIPYISLTKYLLGRKNEVWRNYLPVFADLPD